MKNLKRIDEAVGSILERRASADRLLKDVVKGNTSEVEGIKLSKEMAQGFLDWLQYSTYGKKFGALPFYKLFTAAFNWGLDRFVKGANTELKAEFKELKAKAKEMSKAEMKGESLDEAIDLLKSSWRGTKGWNDVARVMDAGLMKAIKAGSVSVSYAKDYVKSLERMAKRNAKKFFDEYGNFSEDDFIEDVEYNMANESVNEGTDQDRLTHLRKFGIAPNNQPQSGAYIKQVSKPGKFFVDWKDAFDLGDVALEFIKSVGSISEFDIIDLKTMKRTGKQLDVKKGQLGNLRTTYGVRVNESINEAKFSFSEDQVKDVAELIAKAIAKLDKVKTAVHDMEYDAGRGAGFEISMDGEKYEGGSYTVRPNGEVYNAAIGNSFPNAIYAKIGDKDINKIIKNIKKFESVEVSENYDTEQRKEMAAKGFALADGSFPIANLEDLKNAIQAYGRAKDQAKTAKFIVKRAKALGAEDLVPDTDDFQKSLDETSTYIMEGKDIGSWNQGGLKGDKNVLITTFVGPKDIEDFGLGRKCMQINVGMDYISLNPADIVELKDILKSYKVK